MSITSITYLFRSPGTGHSIEELFGSVRRGMARQSVHRTNVVCLPRVSRGLSSVWRNLRFVARQLWPGLVHVTGDVHYAVLALPASRTVLTIHDCITLDANRNRPLRYALFWLLWFYLPIRRAAVVTAVSEKTRQDLLRYVGRIAEKVVVIPNGCDPVFVESSGLDRSGLDWPGLDGSGLDRSRSFRSAQPVLLQIGTAPHKNLPRLTEALDGLACLLVIVGPLSQEMVADLVKRRITYRNYVNLSRAQVMQLYIDCDIVTFVSTYEGFGMPVLEANAVGRVVITSDLPPMRDVAGGAAHLTDPTDAAAIRRGILRLIHDDAYRQHLIDAGYRNAQRYSMATMAAQYRALYDRLVRNKRVNTPAL